MIPPLSVAIPAALVALAVLALLTWRGYRRDLPTRPDFTAYPGLARLNRWTANARYIAIVVGLLVLPISAMAGLFAVGVAVAPITVAIAMEIGLIVTELACRRAARQPGVASLDRRAPRQAFPPLFGMSLWLTALAAVATYTAVLLVSWISPYGGYPAVIATSDTGWSGVACTSMPNLMDIELLQVVLWPVVPVLALIAVFTATSRPRNGADPVLTSHDNKLRQRTVRTAINTLLAGTGGSLAAVGIALMISQRMTSNLVNHSTVQDCVGDMAPPPGYGPWQFSEPTQLMAHPAVLVGLVILTVVGLAVALPTLAAVIADVITPKLHGDDKTRALRFTSPHINASDAEPVASCANPGQGE